MTEEARISELLKPRIKQIADYPDSPQRVGFIYQGGGWSDNWYKEMKIYPHLFSELKWWAERKVEEMPEYVWYDTSSIYEKESLIVLKVAQWLQEPDGEIWASVEGDKIGYSSFFMTKPATKTEYDQHIKTKEK